MQSGERRAHRARGFTYVLVVALLAILSVGLAAVGPAWSEQMRREREQELLRIGRLYARAIETYYLASPGSERRYPPALASLLLDSRHIGTRRHLRRLYSDPVNPGKDWGVVRADDGGIKGIYSQSAETPLRQTAVELEGLALPAAQKYSDWKFAPKVEM